MMDLTESIIPRSDQLNAEDLLSGTRTVTVEDVTPGTSEQPVNIHLAEFPGRPFRPSKTVRRILVLAWGRDSTQYVGRRMTIYRDPDVRFGGQSVGGIRVSHLSHIDKPMSPPLTESRGKKRVHKIEPLAEQPSKIRLDEAKIADSTLEQCGKARDYLTKFQASEPDRVAELLALVDQRETELAGETA